MSDSPDPDRAEAAPADPSIDTVRATFASIQRTARSVDDGCGEISTTLRLLGDALGSVTQSPGASQSWGQMGLLGLPVQGAMRAARAAANNYVRQQTGASLVAWLALVTDAAHEMEQYGARLAQVSAMAHRYAGERPGPTAGEDAAALAELRWETAGWKAWLGRISQVGQVVEAVLQADIGSLPVEDEAAAADSGGSGFGGALRRRIEDAQSRATDRSGELREWLMRPLLDVRDSVRALPGRVESLARDVALLEVLLELQETQIRACIGEVTAGEASAVGVRVAAEVVVPELAHGIAEARERVDSLERRIELLAGDAGSGKVEQQARNRLTQEYRSRLRTERSRLADLEAEAETWRTTGPAVLDAATDWVRLELEVLAARQSVGDHEHAEREVPLRRELEYLGDARTLLAAL